jgi:hypothetical protein
MATLTIPNDFVAGAAIIATDMNANFTALETFVNTTPGVLQLTGGTVTGAVTLSNTLTVGANDTGYDVKLFGATSGAYMLWDEDQDDLVLGGVARLGIGTTSPSDKLHVADAATTVAGTQIWAEGRYGGYGAGISFVSATSSGGTLVEMAKITGDGEASWDTTAANQDAGLRFFTTLNGTSAEKVRIKADGKVGIGTSAPTNDLSIDVPIDTTQGMSLDYSGAVKAGFRLIPTTGEVRIGAINASGSYHTTLYANNAEAVRLQANGDVAFGTTRVGVGHRQYYNLLFPRGGINYSQTNAQDQIWLCSNATVDTGSGWDYIATGEAGLLGVDNGDVLFYSAPSGSGNISWVEAFRVTNAGVLTCASTKSFDIPHPTKGGNHRLRHYDTEGPRPDLIYRGTATLAGGTATVDLDTESDMTDGTWEALCTNPWALVASSGNAVEWSLSGKTLTITSDTADAVCSWMVIGERNDANVGTITTEYETDGSDPFPETEVVEESQTVNPTEPPPVAEHAAA